MRTWMLILILLLPSLSLAINNTRFKPIQQTIQSHNEIKIGDMRLSMKHEKLVDHTARIYLDAQYPHLESNESHQSFNDIISDIVDTELGQFSALVDEIHGTGNLKHLNDLPNDGFSRIDISYETFSVTTGKQPIISILFTIDSFISGGAHPNATHRTLNYNFATGDAIAIADLFKSDVNFIRILNKYCAKHLTKLTGKSEKELVDDNELNYSQWNITPKGILVTFDELPHVYGLQQVLIPYEAIRNIMSDNMITMLGINKH